MKRYALGLGFCLAGLQGCPLPAAVEAPVAPEARRGDDPLPPDQPLPVDEGAPDQPRDEPRDPVAGDPEAACPADAFLDISGSSAAGDAYPASRLDAWCEDGMLIVESNGIPHYRFVQTTPNALAAQDFRWAVPLNPSIGEPEPIPLLGVAGFAINGLPFYGPNEGPFPDPFGDPVANAILDACLGHTAQRGDYHYHAMLQACLRPDVGPNQPSPILGFALDGVPIHGPMGCLDADCAQVVELESGWDNISAGALDCANAAACAADEVCALSMIDGAQRMACVPKTNAWDHNAFVQKPGAQYLDECNGRVGPDGVYRYHATATFPYIVGCYRGGAAEGAGDQPPADQEPPNGEPPADREPPADEPPMEEPPMEEPPAGGPGAPPEEAVQACAGQRPGAPCSFQGQRGEVRGQCMDLQGTLACAPEGGPPMR